MPHVHVVLVLLCGIVLSAHALCEPGTYFMDSTKACGVCPDGEFAANASTLHSRRQGAAATASPICGRTPQNAVGCAEAPKAVDVQVCATDVLNLMQLSPGVHDNDVYNSIVQSAVLGRDGRIVFLMKRRVDSFYVVNTNDNSIQKIPSSLPAAEPLQIDYMAGGVYVPASQSIYSVPDGKDEIHVVSMQNLNTLQIAVLSAIPPCTVPYCQRFGSPILVGASVYFVPMDEVYTLILNVASDGSTTYEQKFEHDVAGVNVFQGRRQFITGVSVGTMLYFVPCAADYVGMMDVSQASIPINMVPVPDDLTGIASKYSDAALANDGYIYLAPCLAPYFSKIDPVTGQITQVPVILNGVPWTRPGDIFGYQCIYSSLVQGRNNKIYFAPYTGRYVFEMDLQDLSASKDITQGGLLFGQRNLGLYSKAILADNGLIYLVPGRIMDHLSAQGADWHLLYTAPVTAICAPALSTPPGLVCIPCPSNSFSLEGPSKSRNITDCKCNAGFSGSTADSCTGCALNSHSPGAAVTCTCNVGYTRDNDVCSLCQPGTYKNVTGDRSCDLCEAGQYSRILGVSPFSLCETCPAQSHSPAQSSAVSNCTCNAGHTCVSDVACLRCEKGTYKTSSGSESCTQCGSDTFSTVTGATSNSVCNACTPPGGDICQSCRCSKTQDAVPADYKDTCNSSSRKYFDADQRQCDTCLLPNQIFNVSWRRSCEYPDTAQDLLHHRQWNERRSMYECIAGFEDVNVPERPNSTQCQPCSPGFFKPARSQGGCQACPTHTTSLGTGSVHAGECAYCAHNRRLQYQHTGNTGYDIFGFCESEDTTGAHTHL